MAFRDLPPGSAVLFEEVTLDGRIGPEAVALLIEPEPDELLARRSLDLNLKGGIAATAHGPVPLLIWRIPPIVNWRPPGSRGEMAFWEIGGRARREARSKGTAVRGAPVALSGDIGSYPARQQPATWPHVRSLSRKLLTPLPRWPQSGHAVPGAR